MSARTLALRMAVLVLAAGATVWAARSGTAVYVGGDSMSPSLSRGDLVLLRRGPDGMERGDVVLVDKAGWRHGVLHRVVTVRFDGMVELRGDANPTADRDPYPVTAVRGVAVLVVPTGRMLSGMERLAARWYNPASHGT